MEEGTTFLLVYLSSSCQFVASLIPLCWTLVMTIKQLNFHVLIFIFVCLFCSIRPPRHPPVALLPPRLPRPTPDRAHRTNSSHKHSSTTHRSRRGRGQRPPPADRLPLRIRQSGPREEDLRLYWMTLQVRSKVTSHSFMVTVVTFCS